MNSSSQVLVQHCLLIRHGGPDPNAYSDAVSPLYLSGVHSTWLIPAESKFPISAKPPWAVFLRIRGINCGSVRVLFRVHFQDVDGVWKHVENARHPMNRSIPFPEDGEGTHDVVLNLPYLQLGGIGLHAISVHFWYDGIENESDEADEIPAWATDPDEMFHTQGWVFGAAEYFWIENLS